MHVLADRLWPGLALFAALYVSDYAFTLACARMYHGGVREIIAFEGSFELTPFFEKDVDALRAISPRFVVAMAWTLALLSVLWWASAEAWPQAYLFTLGAVLLLELAVHTRHSND
jgi:hypothetical protein